MKNFTFVSPLLNLLLLSNVEAIKGKQRKTARKPAIPRAAATEEEGKEAPHQFQGSGSRGLVGGPSCCAVSFFHGDVFSMVCG